MSIISTDQGPSWGRAEKNLDSIEVIGYREAKNGETDH